MDAANYLVTLRRNAVTREYMASAVLAGTNTPVAALGTCDNMDGAISALLPALVADAAARSIVPSWEVAEIHAPSSLL